MGSFVVSYTCAAVLVVLLAAAAQAAPLVPAYGEVARFGGFDSGATYSTSGSSPTTNLPGTGEQAKLVYPIGMAVDSEDPNAPDKYAVYVLENINPQALNGAETVAPTSLSLEYRIQKIGDKGEVLASKSFTLTSTAEEPGLHAASLAVDGPADRVYVLIMDDPPVAENTNSYSAVDAIDAWTTGRESGKQALEPAVGKTTGVNDNLKEDSRTGGGELAGSSTLQSGAFTNYVDGASLAVYGEGETADLALGGNQYVSSAATTPVVELIKTAGAEAGKVDGTPWTNAAATEDTAAHAAEQASEFLYSLSSNPDGSLSASLGGGFTKEKADLEPNMATIGGAGLAQTTAVLPGSIVSENFIQPEPNTDRLANQDAAATVAYSQDIHEDGKIAFMPSGGTRHAGTLAPSVTQLAGGGSFPSEMYAGIVTHLEETTDRQNPTPSASEPETLPSWRQAIVKQESGVRSIVQPASLGIRVFDAASESLAMIGNVTAGGPCNLQGSPPEPFTFNYSVNGNPSFVALAPGREGVLFALVQPDLLNVSESATTEWISPANAVAAGEGDQIVEFAPGTNSTGAGSNATKWVGCPQPEGGFSIANGKEPPSTGNGEVSVQAGSTLSFDAEVNLQGGSPWAYDWSLEGGVNKEGTPALFNDEWSVRNTFAPEPEKRKAYQWPLPTAEAEFKIPGTYTETLNLVNDFGTLTSQRTLRVIEVGKPTNVKVVPSAGATEGQPLRLMASATLPADDKVKDYHWEFGDSQGEDTGEHGESEHTYARAGTYTVKLTVTDAIGQKAEAEQSVTVASVPTKETKETTTSTTTTATSTTKSVTTTTTTTTSTTKSKSLTKAQKLAAALKACRKEKLKKRRASCERRARAKYGTKRGKKKKKKK